MKVKANQVVGSLTLHRKYKTSNKTKFKKEANRPIVGPFWFILPQTRILSNIRKTLQNANVPNSRKT